jgi:hypothetical protein
MPKFADEIGKAIVDRIPKSLAKTSQSSGIANGSLAKSFSYTVKNDQIQIESSTDYATFADTGRKPGKPAPFVPVYDWVQRYKIGPARVRETTARQMSWIICRDGTKPLNYLQDAIDFIWNTRKDLFIGAGKDVVLKQIDKIIK